MSVITFSGVNKYILSLQLSLLAKIILNTQHYDTYFYFHYTLQLPYFIHLFNKSKYLLYVHSQYQKFKRKIPTNKDLTQSQCFPVCLPGIYFRCPLKMWLQCMQIVSHSGQGGEAHKQHGVNQMAEQEQQQRLDNNVLESRIEI